MKKDDQAGLASKGQVEVLYNGTWGGVCDNDWDVTDANVVCRQLGFPGGVAATTSAASGAEAGKIWMHSLRCTGNESSLTDCSHGGWEISNCDHGHSAGVICNRGGKIKWNWMLFISTWTIHQLYYHYNKSLHR